MTTNPLKVQTATSPNSLKEMTTADMAYSVDVILKNFATLTTGTGTVQVNPGVTTGLTSIGGIDDYRLDAAGVGSQVGTTYASTYAQGFQTFYSGFGGAFFTGFFTGTFATNPYSTAFSTNYQTFYGGFGGTIFTGFYVGRANTVGPISYDLWQDRQSVSESLGTMPVKWDALVSGVKQMTDIQLQDTIIEEALDTMVAGGIGSYQLNSSTPAGGTWTSRGAVVDTYAGSSTTYTLWQKTNDTAPTTARPLKHRLNGNVYDLIELTDVEIQAFRTRFQNRILNTGKGLYAFQTSAPGTGTWAQVGIDVLDTERQTFVGAFAGVNATYRGRYVGAGQTTSTTVRLWVRTA